MLAHSSPWINAEDYAAIETVLTSNMLAAGRLADRFANDLSSLLGCRPPLLTASGTRALELALRFLGVSHDDEVILPTYVCKNVLQAVQAVGASPVLCDIQSDWRVYPDDIEDKITSKTKAIVVVHIFGIVSNVEAIKRFSIPIIEDACQSFGSQRDGIYSGTVGDIGVLSFQATKTLTTGEGGAIIVNDQTLFESVDSNAFKHELSDLSSALGISQLARFNQIQQRRHVIAKRFNDAIVGKKSSIILPDLEKGELLFRYVLKSPAESFEYWQNCFLARDISIRKGVDALLHHSQQPSQGCFPVSEQLFRQTLSLPFYPALTDAQVDHIVESIDVIFS